MPVFPNATSDTYTSEGLHQNQPIQVRLDEGSIAISYQDDDGPVVYEGLEIESGHFELDCARKRGKAILHRMPGENVLEGWWLENRIEGMWRIYLNSED
jgi:hypothetical protein